MAIRTVRLQSRIPALVKEKSWIEAVVVLRSEIPHLWQGESKIVPTVTLSSRIG